VKGILYGVGVGPGDPELITVKAVKTLKNVQVIALPTVAESKHRAYDIALEACPGIGECELLKMEFPMTRDKEVLQKSHEQLYGRLREVLEQGRNVAYLTIGDPTIYSTFFYLAEPAKADGYEVQVIGGVPSFCASAAAAKIPVCLGDEEVHILPGEYQKEDRELDGVRIYMKSGKKLQQLREDMIKEEESSPVCVYAVSNCGLEGERIGKHAESIPTEDIYMTTVLVRPEKEDC